MSHAREPMSAPPRISADPGALGELLRAARNYTPPLDQRAAFARLLERSRGRRRRFWSTPALAYGLAAACVVALVAIGSFRGAERSELGVEQQLAAPAPHRDLVTPALPPSSSNVPEPSPPRSLALPAGESRLDDGTRVRLARASSAAVENSPGGVRVGLEQGSISVDVAKQAEGRSFEVRANAYRFVAIGTSFTVSASGDRVELDVREGRVAVLRGSNELARVGAGESWPPPPSSAAPRAAESAAPPAAEKPSIPEKNCLELARARRAREAESCFVAQAAIGGLGAELALFELSRLRSDVLGDPAGALAALKEYRTRFPDGSLRAEVDVSHVHLLARLGRHAELVSESARLLQAVTGRERGAELRMLRANAFRMGLKDFRSAEREYAQVEKGGSKFATDASFYRGVCLEALGDRSGAAQAYRRYLDVPGRAREAEARRRLTDLEP